MPPRSYKRDPEGNRFGLKGMNTVMPPDRLPPGKVPYAQNVRSYMRDEVIARMPQGNPVLTLAGPIHSLRRLNDSTPNGPAGGFAYIAGSGYALYCNQQQVANGLSGNALCLGPFRPNASVQPWMYVSDSLQMLKVNADGTCYKQGVAEPQQAPTVTLANQVTLSEVEVLGTTMPWLTAGGLNSAYNYGLGNGTAPVQISCSPGDVLKFSVVGLVDGSTANTIGPSTSTSPGAFVTSGPTILMGAWTDGNGNVLAVTASPTSTLTVPTTPAGIQALQLGVDADTAGGNYSVNNGYFNVFVTRTVPSTITSPGLSGPVSAEYWGDSPHSGPVAQYIWKNATDGAGSGPVRTTAASAGTTTGNSLVFDSGGGTEANPVAWTIYDPVTLAVSGTQSLFSPALESEGYQDFNVAITFNLFIPAAGVYTLTAVHKDGIVWGLDGTPTWSGKGSVRGNANQTKTALNGYQLLPATPPNGTGGAVTSSVAITCAGPGVYAAEIGWDYWYHSGRTLVVTCNGQPLLPITTNVKVDVQYRCVFRSSQTGAKSNGGPPSIVQQLPVLQSTITPTYSADPQVDKVDFYRIDSEIDSYTYAGTGPNTNPPTPFVDGLLDLDIATNPLLEEDNFEPFPSIDLPRSGTVNVVGGVITRQSGDLFNIRWLPGTVINIGGVDYTTVRRPQDQNVMVIETALDGVALAYEIQEPGLAAQPLPSVWGPTDNVAFRFGCGDPLRPGTLYWDKGNTPDSAPDTNQEDVTSPSEPLMNGCIVNGLALVFSTERAWRIYPNFSSASATVTGVSGSAFTLVGTITTRGLYIRTALATDGGGRVAFRAKDGIAISNGGEGEESISQDIDNLFPHEGRAPAPIMLSDYTVYPPDDTQPQYLAFANGYLYYDYLNTSGVPCTLVYDLVAGGWFVDTYQWPVLLHVLQEGEVNGTLTCCVDGTARALASGGPEQAEAVVLTRSEDGGETRANKQLGDIFVRATVTQGMQAKVYTARYMRPVTGYSPTSLTGTGVSQDYIIDFTDGLGEQINDIEMAFLWPIGDGAILEMWQPDWIDQPEATQNRPGDWDDSGSGGALFVQGIILEADTYGLPKRIAVQSSDDGSLHVPDQSPVSFNGQSKQALTFTPPFVAHSMRIVSTDSIPWRVWGREWVVKPYPELAPEWATEMSSHGEESWMHIGAVMNIGHISTADITLTLQFDQQAPVVIIIPNSGGVQRKDEVMIPARKFKLISYRLSSTQAFRLFAGDCTVRIGTWGRQEPYKVVKPFGGPSSLSAEV